MEKDIKSRAAKSVVWSFAEKLSVQGIGFIISLILARLLVPEDYGVIAILHIFISVATVFIDGGFSNALIQNQKRTEKDFSTAFYTNIGVACFCYLILFFVAPYLADFFLQPLLKDVMRIYGISLIISSFALVQKSRFYINYNFRIIAYISFIAIVLGGIVAIFMAYKGLGVWSLVWYHIIVELIRTVSLWLLSRWKPSLCFSRQSFYTIFGFGSKLLVANMINIIAANLPTFMIGRLFNATNLGLFNRGQSLAYFIPLNFSNVLTQACYPVFCEVQNDGQRLRFFFVKYVRISFVIISPVMTILAVLASPLVSFVLTDKWLPCVPFIQILAIGYMFDPVMRLNANVINVTGHSEYTLYSEIFKKTILLFILMTTCWLGLIGMAIGLALYSLVDLLAVSIYVKKVVGVNFINEMVMLVPQILYCAITGIIVSFCSNLFSTPIIQLVVGTLTGVFTYALLMLIFSRSLIGDLVKLFNMIKK
ncbi:lipopolysaccharide biosynthesis protein [Bacteroides cellulosilyticus]|uniref:Lipopolysaccharide biosynthesis protein n=1 Tax=Bacteroides cellulosilyticus TaxID=246787 RepID=A0A5M6A3K7_9BACE|nr:lipopolysaccharide biosynthesis protein [Bacteroides cellulosilyticus]KAA5403992.1 lipopolysaccharide biosynthesis protein [Bacteroides cellulosilyticus]